MSSLSRQRLRDPILWNAAFQLLKTATAAVLAWVLAVNLFHLPQPFLAPWSALLVVHATVYRSFSRGLQQVAATVVAVFLAAGVGHVLGLSTVAIAVLMLVALALGALPWFGAEATTVATTALVVLTTGYSNDNLLVSRLMDTGIGIATGLLVNVAVWPPLRRRATISAIDAIDDAIGGLLTDIGEGLEQDCDDDEVEAWASRARDLDGDLEHAWALVRQTKESARLNLRRSARSIRDPREWYELLHRMEQAVAETRSLVRTVGGGVVPRRSWDPLFAAPWTSLLVDAGRAVSAADPELIADLRVRLDELMREILALGKPLQHWPIYGALTVNLRNILDAMDAVAGANPMSHPPLPRLRSGRPLKRA